MSESTIKTFALAGPASYNTTSMTEKGPFWMCLLLGTLSFGCQQPQTYEPPAWPERPPPPLPSTPAEQRPEGTMASPSTGTRSVPPARSSGTLAEQYRGHTPLDRQQGEATYYADSLAGNSTASGEPYRPELFTAAHRTLPFGTIVRVVRTDTGQVTYAKVNDRGPFGKRTRIIDLSRAAAEQLAMMRAGVVPVRVEVLEQPAASASR